MKVTCILTSYNRPNWIRQSLRSIAEQTHKDVQLIIMDESTTFDIYEAAGEFPIQEVVIRKFHVTQLQRKSQNRLGMNLNVGLTLATGDLVCFLADDDYFYPTWFEKAVAHFAANPEVKAAYGKLVYSDSSEMVFTDQPAPCNLRFFKGPLADPFNRIDHNQAIHRRFKVPFRWPESLSTVGGPDAHYFRGIAKKHLFYPIPEWAAVKRVHKKNLQSCMGEYMSGSIDGPRE